MGNVNPTHYFAKGRPRRSYFKYPGRDGKYFSCAPETIELIEQELEKKGHLTIDVLALPDVKQLKEAPDVVAYKDIPIYAPM
jgi:hypothetical protein